MASFVDFISVWTEICKNCSIVVLVWRHHIFSMFSLRGILVCSLKMLFFSHRIVWHRLISFQKDMQLWFLSFCVFQPLFLGINSENLWLLLKIKECFPSFLLTLFWCSTSYTVIIVLWKILKEPVNANARWWSCSCLKCGSGLRRLGKNVGLFETHKCPWPGAQILFRHKWRKLVTASLSLHCIDSYSCFH